MKKYILLLIGNERTYPIFETDDFEEFSEKYREESKEWGVEKIIPVKKLDVQVSIIDKEGVNF